MKQATTFIILIFLSAFSFGQDAAQVSGTIKGDNDKPLASATVSLLKTKDSSLVKIAVTNNNGVFKIVPVLKIGSLFSFCNICCYIKSTTSTFEVKEGQDYNSAPLTLLA